jgi:hypothetical protein
MVQLGNANVELPAGAAAASALLVLDRAGAAAARRLEPRLARDQAEACQRDDSRPAAEEAREGQLEQLLRACAGSGAAGTVLGYAHVELPPSPPPPPHSSYLTAPVPLPRSDSSLGSPAMKLKCVSAKTPGALLIGNAPCQAVSARPG